MHIRFYDHPATQFEKLIGKATNDGDSPPLRRDSHPAKCRDSVGICGRIGTFITHRRGEWNTTDTHRARHRDVWLERLLDLGWGKMVLDLGLDLRAG